VVLQDGQVQQEAQERTRTVAHEMCHHPGLYAQVDFIVQAHISNYIQKDRN
jgi:hypothetical protein